MILLLLSKLHHDNKGEGVDSVLKTTYALIIEMEEYVIDPHYLWDAKILKFFCKTNP